MGVTLKVRMNQSVSGTPDVNWGCSDRIYHTENTTIITNESSCTFSDDHITTQTNQVLVINFEHDLNQIMAFTLSSLSCSFPSLSL